MDSFFPQELDIVDEQHVDVPVFVPEGFVGIVLDGADQFIGEGFTGNIQNLHFRMVIMDVVADGVHQMGLAQARVAVQEKGVVALAGALATPMEKL